ncbi:MULTISPECIES: hypothetical protein [Trichocoleus]|uniref:SprT-like domain-containing protein n=1 Tax=Trichocoleus desertorum GB2-A4 TaxID=2933944 RepID=A0ABV0JCJ0_9CYAN|nr:hypothetical protein [Trichocoleus sp. FACHB-46]MBD1864151.1 hypothetical protein [Trichocoleus sp. FACHB-46]
MLPLVVSHELVHFFKFLYDHEIREGMCSEKELYCLWDSFPASSRQKAFAVAMDLAEQGSQVCITCMRAEYKIWVSLRTLPLSSAIAPVAQPMPVAA